MAAERAGFLFLYFLCSQLWIIVRFIVSRSNSKSARSWIQRVRLATLWAGPLALAAISACGNGMGDHPAPPPATLGDGHPVARDAGAEACVPGTTRECHEKLAEHGGITTCLLGVATCTDEGAYGPCEGSFVSRRGGGDADPASSRAGSISAEPAATAAAPSAILFNLSDAGACQNDPCDPSCSVFDEDPPSPISPEPTPTGSYQGGSVSSIPNGFYGKGIVEPCSTTSDCQFDEHCVSGSCTPWKPGETDAACSGVDLTVGVPCSGTVPVCNRGNTEAAAGVTLYVYNANEPKFPLCNPSITEPSVAGSCTVSEKIPAGACVDVTNADCTKWQGGGALLSGNKTVMVNPPVAGARTECACENNWSDYHSGGCQSQEVYAYAQQVYEQVYTASCPAGTRVQWGVFTYTTTTPGDSDVVFAVHTADTVAALAAPLVTVATAKATPAPDTQSCQLGDAGCPKDLYAALGGSPAAARPVLEIVMTLDPTSDASQGPSVLDWSVTYSCPASE
jgi:hypothetical protein